jgi:branched-subunit amino acid aminotransferase/4-amino-4-deoxychorismate lyase
MLYVNVNGEIVPQSEGAIRAGNRGHLYGDGLFESIRLVKGCPINLENHLKRLRAGAEKLKMRFPAYQDLRFFEERIIELAAKSGIQFGGKCRLHLDRIAGGNYSPEANETEFLIEVYPLESDLFELNTKGLEVDIYMTGRKQKNALSNFKTKNGLLYVLSAIEAREKGIDEFLISNESGGIIESTSNNLFVVSNSILYTPGLEEGCLAGTMRMQVINLALENGIKVYECNMLPQNLLVADEIILTNAIKGISWVGGYRTKRYHNNMAQQLTRLLNEKWNPSS